MYISAAEVLRKFYRLHLNLQINDISCSVIYMQDVYGRDRIAIWETRSGYYGVPEEVRLQGGVCVECGSYCSYHDTLTGCCPLDWDIEGEVQELVEREAEAEDEDEQIQDEEERIPEVTWDSSIPSQDALRQRVLDNLEEAFQLGNDNHEEYDIEAEMADYAEYQRELEEELWNDWHGR
jgi:hypothetical protein